MFPFPFRKTPLTKIERVKKSVSNAAHALLEAVPAEKIEDKLDELKKAAALAALHAAQVAHHAGEVASHKIEEWQHSGAHWGESAASVAHESGQNAASAVAAAAAKAQRARDAAQEAAQTARDALQERAASLKTSAVSFKESLQERAAHDFSAGRAEAENAKTVAKNLAEQSAKVAQSKEVQLENTLEKKKDEIAGQVADKKAQFEARQREFQSPIEVEYQDSPSKWLWILLGLVAGAILALLFAPTTGRRSRAVIKDRLGKVSGGTADAAAAASDKVVDIAHRVEGLAHKIETKISADSLDADDSTLADRVRSVLGHHEVARTLERLNIDCADGVVTLRGPLLDAQTQEILIQAVKAVPGVKEVVSDLLIDEEPEDPANYAR